MVCIGDKVKVIREGGIFTTYTSFMTEYVAKFRSIHTQHISGNYRENDYPTEDEKAHNFTVEYIAEHSDFPGIIVAIISSDITGRVFIYNADALSVVTPVSSHKVGQKIRIKDNSHTYADWDTLIRSQRGVIASDLCDVWSAGKTPTEGTEGKVLWVGRHVSRSQEDVLYIVQTGEGVFVLGEKGLEFTEDTAGDITWEKYLIYVRNWCTKHKNFAPSSNAGPLSLPEWEKEYKAHTLVI
jgi:hypothetical protein